MRTLFLKSKARVEFIDITAWINSELQSWIGEPVKAVVVYTPHTTVGITVSVRQGGDTKETGPVNGDSDVVEDQIDWLRVNIPHYGPDRGFVWGHYEQNSDAHIMGMLTGNSVVIPVEDRKLKMGKWQSVFFCEFDGQRERQVWLSFLS